ncbi:MAG: twin-arginine translocase TatA/TatE family subunit [Phycisphaerae bacterium]|nr:twin-arginine translocase TatA/TatE family subunit [Phycisphaerae bacterium]
MDIATNMLAFFQRIGWLEILVILLAILLLFGGRKLPELARGLARGIKSFRKEMKSVGDEMRDAMSAEDDAYDSTEDSQNDDSAKNA